MCCRKKGRFLAFAAIAIGTVILLTLILPPWFWWLISGLAFLVGGILLLKR